MSDDRNQATAALFGRAAATYDRIGPRFFSYFGQRLVEVAGIAAGSQVLDVACGTGAVSFPAAEQVGAGGSVIGVDLAAEMVEQARHLAAARNVRNVEFQVMDADQLDFPDETFDAVVCGFALFFLRDMAQTLAELRRVLKPGGVLALSMWGRSDERWDWLFEVTGKYMIKHPPEADPPEAAADQPDTHSVAGLRVFVENGGFAPVRVLEEDHDIFYADESEWLAVQWSHGARIFLEMTPAGLRDAMIAELFTHLQLLRTPDGIPERQTVLFAVGIKPT